MGFEVGEEGGEEAEGGKPGADVVDGDDGGHVGEFAEDGCADAAHAEGEAEEEAGDHADASGDEFLGVDEDGGEGGGDDDSDENAEDAGPEEVGPGHE